MKIIKIPVRVALNKSNGQININPLKRKIDPKVAKRLVDMKKADFLFEDFEDD